MAHMEDFMGIGLGIFNHPGLGVGKRWDGKLIFLIDGIDKFIGHIGGGEKKIEVGAVRLDLKGILVLNFLGKLLSDFFRGGFKSFARKKQGRVIFPIWGLGGSRSWQ